MSILRLLGRKYGYYPVHDADLMWEVDSLLSSVDDYLNIFMKYMFEPNFTLKEKAMERYLETAALWFSVLQKRLQNKTYLVGSSITIADFAVSAIIFDHVHNHYCNLSREVRDMIKPETHGALI
jgi:glutathione S-transferase